MAPATVLLVALALVGGAFAASPFPRTEILAEEDAAVLSVYRLPHTTRPTHYTVRISPDMTPPTFGYAGQVTMTILANEPDVRQIQVQSQDLTIMSISVTAQGTTLNILENYELDTTYNYIYINLNAPLNYNAAVPQYYTVFIQFQGVMRSDMYGFYRSWYTHNGEVRWMGTTQFQATSARAAFPCYDEPSFKATFDIIIERPEAFTSWSNMRIARGSEPSGTAGRVVDYFDRTPVMSTYLIAFIVAEYQSLPVFDDNNEIEHEVIARPNAIADGQGTYALTMGQDLLEEMNIQTGIEYTSQGTNMKMTQASIPDFSAGAMENWGLLTYRESYLMYHPEHTSSRFQQIIAYILSHEIAHMWFGNLVTCEWWDVLWLNEGFARYYQYYLTDAVDPRMGFDERFIPEQVHTAMFADSVNNAHALTNPTLASPGSVSAHFSTITYNKGAAVIRMTEHLLGSDVHRQGLHHYLTERSHNTARPEDLFESLDLVSASSGALAEYGSGFTVAEYYKTWTEQPGYPILTVHINHQTGDMSIEQRRFDRNVGYSSILSTWIIPISFASAENPDFSNTKPTHIIRDTLTVINRGTTGDQWTIFNKQQTGFYRVNYDDYTWGLITLMLRSPQRIQIHEYNRAQIVDDVFQFARAGLMSYTRAFNILSFMEFERHYAPWLACISGMNFLRRRFVGTENEGTFENMFIEWTQPLMSELTYYPIDGEDWMRSYLRSQIAPVLCSMGVPACRTAATAQFAQLRGTPSVQVPVDSRHWVYCNALRDSTDVSDWNFLWQRYQTHEVHTEKIILLENLGCTTNVASLSTFLSAVISDVTVDNLIRPQDYGSAMNSAIGGNEENSLLVFNWITENYPAYSAVFPNANHLGNIIGRLHNEAQINQVLQWRNANQGTLPSNVINSIDNNVAAAREMFTWTNTITPDVIDYIEGGGYQDVELTSAAPAPPTDPPVTVTPPDVEAPVVPEWDGGGAASLTTSFITLFLALVAGIIANRH